MSTPKVINIARAGGIGDILMCTPALRSLKAAMPEREIVFFGAHLDILRGLPYIDQLKHFDERPADALWLNYEGGQPIRQHIARQFAQQLDVVLADVRPDCHVDPDLDAKFTSLFTRLPKPWVVINRRASGWTPNKDWSDEKWIELIARLVTHCGVIEIGSPTKPDVGASDNYLNLLGRTTIDEMIAVIAAADVLVSPISGPVHVAAATLTRSVVIYGGYEEPVGTAYDGNELFYSAVECAPCWLTGPCPNGRKCLSMITVDDVEAAVWKIWRSPMDATKTADVRAGLSNPSQDAQTWLQGDLAMPRVLDSANKLYVAYRPDSDIMYNRHPEMRELAENWVSGNLPNNSGDLPRFYMLAFNIKAVLADGVPGQFAELGVYKGNSGAVLAHYARKHGRDVFLFDTFSGFAQEDLCATDSDKRMEFEDTTLDLVLRNTGTHSVRCVQGRFPDSVTPEIADQKFAVVHLDCDLYEPMRAALEFFYPRLSPGGALIVHDYINEYWDGIKLAVDEFRQTIPEQFVLIPDKSGSAVLRKAR